MKLKYCLTAVLLVLICATSGLAQAVAGMGGMSGVVRDGSGATVPGAQVVVDNPSKGIRRTLETNTAGVFAAPALVPATGYTLRITKEGFAPYEAKNLEILVGQDVSLNVTLAIGATQQQVEVLAVAPIVEQTKTEVSQVVESGQIRELPINGRRVDTFVLLTPAVVPDGTYGLVSFRGIAGGNAFLTDGNDTTNQFYNENAGRSRVSAQISQDAVQEFQVLSSGYSAEYGRASGGVINTVTRSGGNDLHGTAYWFFRNQDLSARDRFASVNPPETRHQVGGSLGGKIIKDKLFYFLNTEITRRDFPLVASDTRAPLYDGSGNFVGACGAPATPEQCAAAIKYVNRRFGVFPRTPNQELLFGKIDWRPTERHSISASMNYLRFIATNGIQTGAALSNGAATGSNGNSTVRVRYGRVSWTAIATNSMLNELRFGWFKDRQADEFNPAFIPPETGYANITVQGLSNIGVANYLPRLNPSENRLQLADNLSWTRGAHTMKFGVDFANTEDYVDSMYNRWGSFSYGTFTDFAQDFSGNATGAKHWQSFSQTVGNPVVDPTIKDLAFYFQDQYRASRRLTLNYGVRYEKAILPQPSITNPDYPQTGHIPSPNTNFGPRIGVAYSFNNDKTVLRAGYGIFYARFTGAALNTFFTQNGVYQSSISLNGSRANELAMGPVFPGRLSATTSTPPPGSVSLTFPSADFRNPYTEQGDLAIEHQITSNLGLTVSYLWSRGLHLTSGKDLNMGPIGPTVSYKIMDLNGNQVGTYSTAGYLTANRVDTRYRRLVMLESASNSYYNALAVQLRKRLSHGLSGSIAYTWSHAIDFAQGGGDSNTFYTSGFPNTVVNGDYRGEKGSSSLDQRHRLIVSSVYAPTLTSRTDAMARYLINGWQLSQISTFASARPDTATVSISGLPYTGAPYYSLNGFGGSSRVPFWPLNSLDIDNQIRTDARITKILPFSENFKGYLNFEAFNVFNHVMNTSINTLAFQVRSGAITPVARVGYGVQSAGFPDGTNARRAQISMRLVF